MVVVMMVVVLMASASSGRCGAGRSDASLGRFALLAFEVPQYLAREPEVVVQCGERDSLQSNDNDLRDSDQMFRVLLEYINERFAGQAENDRVLHRFGRHGFVGLQVALFSASKKQKIVSWTKRKNGLSLRTTTTYCKNIHNAEE